MMVTATRVEADPMGVRLPPRLAPKITAHQSGSVGGRMPPPAMGISLMILASIAARGMLSVTELNRAADTRIAPVPRVGPRAIIRSSPIPISANTSACSITLITTKSAAKKPSRSQSIV